MLLHRLDLKGIIISMGSACDSKYAMGTIRISLSKDNSKEEIMIIAKAIIDILNKNSSLK